MLHGFYDAPDISLVKIEVSFTLHAVFENKVKARMSYIRDMSYKRDKIAQKK